MEGVPKIRMASQDYLMNLAPGSSDNEVLDSTPKTKLYYEEKAVGSTLFYKCEACPYMALAEDDIKFHLFTVHLDLARSNGLADNVQIPCPGCAEVFDAENTLRCHLKDHHKMGVKDIRKMVKSLILIALKNSKPNPPRVKTPERQIPPAPLPQLKANIPEVIEIVPDIVPSDKIVPGGITVISVDELQKMSTPTFETFSRDPKEIIQEASINIVYSEDVSNYSEEPPKQNLQQHAPPDLISSIQTTHIEVRSVQSTHTDSNTLLTQECQTEPANMAQSKEIPKKTLRCSVDGCSVHFESREKLLYHQSCHQKGKLNCPECKNIFFVTKALHMHLWKLHNIDMELHKCDRCDYKTYSLSRLNNIHKKIHSVKKDIPCPVCGKTFKSLHQMGIHKRQHNENLSRKCETCAKTFVSDFQLKRHIQISHEGTKPFKCGECDFATARKFSLKLHIRSHTGEAYKCEECEFTSCDHNSLRRHKLQHGDQKKYRCKHCSYTAIQSSPLINHVTRHHPDAVSDDIFSCPYCKFKSVNRDKLLNHLLKHNNTSIIDLNTQQTSNFSTETPKRWNTLEMRPRIETPEQIAPWTAELPQKNWNTPNEKERWKPSSKQPEDNELVSEEQPLTIDENQPEVPIEVDDCDSEQDPSNFPVNYSYVDSVVNQESYRIQEILTDLTENDNNSDCIISESSNDTERPQYYPHNPMAMTAHPVPNSNLREYLGPSVSSTIDNNLLQDNNVVTSNSLLSNNLSTSIMNNFPIYLPPNPRISIRRNLTLTPSDHLPMPMSKSGPIINSSQILPIPTSSSSPVQNTMSESEGVPKKKAKISVKSNLILKGPDNMFNSEQSMVFTRLQDDERLNLSSPVTFNNLITTCMQLPPEPALKENSVLPPYTHEPLLQDPNAIKDSRMYTFNRQMDLGMLSQQISHSKMSIISGNPNFIKLESKQNIQSPGLERISETNTHILDGYCKASPRLEDMQKNVQEIKNEIKSDIFFNIPSSQSSPNVMDGHLLDIATDMYVPHTDLSVIPDIDQEPDIIEIDDNSEDNKILPPRYNMYPVDYLHNDFYFLESELNVGKVMTNESVEMGEIEQPVTTNKDVVFPDIQNVSLDNFIHGRIDPMMNTPVRSATNKINVKNIELMKN